MTTELTRSTCHWLTPPTCHSCAGFICLAHSLAREIRKLGHTQVKKRAHNYTTGRGQRYNSLQASALVPMSLTPQANTLHSPLRDRKPSLIGGMSANSQKTHVLTLGPIYKARCGGMCLESNFWGGRENPRASGLVRDPVSQTLAGNRRDDSMVKVLPEHT